jgi:hypothetical protein
MDDIERRPFRLRDEAHLRFDDARERAFGADDHAREVERLWLGELVQIVAGDAAQNLRIAREDFVAVLFRERAHFVIRAALDAVVEIRFPLEILGRKVFQHDERAVRKTHRELQHVIDGLAVRERMSAGGVVADHAADGGAVRGRGVGTEEQSLAADMRVELVLHDAGLHAAPELLFVHFEHAIHGLGEIEHDGMSDRLAGQRRAAAARQHRDLEAFGGFHGRLHVALMALGRRRRSARSRTSRRRSNRGAWNTCRSAPRLRRVS